MSDSLRTSEVTQSPLAGLRVLEISGGVAAAYCTRLLVDAGASVSVLKLADDIEIDSDPVEHAYRAYLAYGKLSVDPAIDSAVEPAVKLAALLDSAASAFDFVVIGEDVQFTAAGVAARIATLRFTWFGSKGEYHNWRGNDLIIQALTGLPHMAGAVDGPPIHAGARQSSLVAGVSGYIALMAALYAPRANPAPTPTASQRNKNFLELNILEANLVLSEMHMHFFERDGIRMKRHGLNRFYPNSPVGVYPCKDGWVGITATTPEQWKSLCVLLQLTEQANDESLMTRELRFERIGAVEQAMINAMADQTAEHWAALGRLHKVPIVVVPNAAGILAHPIFNERKSFSSFEYQGKDLTVPRAPCVLLASGAQAAPAANLAAPQSEVKRFEVPQTENTIGAGMLAGVTVIDFAMGWAGPLTGRLLADLGAEVIKIEAGRYPDWWRGVNWTREYIETKQYENAKGFCALNRGKRGVSVDLTTDAGRRLALELIASADLVVENQAAGVMRKLGLNYEELVKVNPEIIMVSMSAFGTGNAWSDTRAYGSTLEQGAGLPSFMGFAGTAPTMYQLAYGDPVGGLFGCAAALSALLHKRRTGRGQYVNLSMVEAMLQFATPALLEYQLSGSEPLRRGNGHRSFSPHGIFKCSGEDQWLALAVSDAQGFANLAKMIGRPQWAGDPTFQSLAGRREHEAHIASAINNWSQLLAPEVAAQQLQAAGIAAAPVLHADELAQNQHLEQSGFFIELVREFSGPQRQAGVSITRNGARLGSRMPAPLLGEHSWAVLNSRASVDRASFDQLVAQGVITFAPTAVRNTKIA